MLKRLLVIVLLLLLGACSVEPQGTPPTRVVTGTPDYVGTVVSAPTLPPLTISMQSPAEDDEAALPAPPLPPKPCTLDGPAPRPQYLVDATLDWDDHLVSVSQQLQYTNTTGTYQNELVFHVEPNRLINQFGLNGISTPDNRRVTDISYDANRMVVPLPEALGENCALTLNLRFTLNIPPVIGGSMSRAGYFGYTEKQVNLGHWLPTLALYNPGLGDWYTPRPSTSYVGEITIAEASDFKVTIKLQDAPPATVVAGPGKTEFTGDKTWQFELEAARDIAFSVGNGFQRRSKIAENGVVIEVYFYPDYEPPGFNAADHTLESAERALLLYEEQFGVDYPYERLVIVEGDFPDGMEFTGLSFVSAQWFTGWRGEQNSWLTLITVHEVAHQWWYALLGNDPAAYPYLDEAFATYSEYLYLEKYFPEYRSWWWSFRVDGYELSGGVDTNIYQYEESRPYINAVYLRGAQMLHEMRETLGDPGFFDWLQSYTRRYQYQMVTPAELWGELSAEDYRTVQAIRQQYLSQAEVLAAEPEEGTALPVGN